MHILNFQDFLNEAFLEPINKKDALIAFVLSRITFIDKFSIEMNRELFSQVFPEYDNLTRDELVTVLKKKDLSDMIHRASRAVGIQASVLESLIKSCKKKKEQLKDTSVSDRAIKKYWGYLQGLASTVDTRGAIRDLREYLRNPNDPKTTSFYVDEMYSESLLAKEFSRLHFNKTRINSSSKEFFLYSLPKERDEESSLFEDIKNMKFPEEDVRNMIRIGLYHYPNVDLRNYDLIVYPKSTSKLLKIFIEEVVEFIKIQQEKTGIKVSAPVTAEAFVKLKGKDCVWDTEKIEKISNPDTKKNLLKVIENTKHDRTLSLSKDVASVMFRSYLLKFLDLSNEGKREISSHSNILILDDCTSGGATLEQMQDLVSDANSSAKTYSLVVIKNGLQENEKLKK